MRIAIPLAAAALALLSAGCAVAPEHVDPFAGIDTGKSGPPAAYPGLSLAIVLTQNTKNSIAYADKARGDMSKVSVDMHHPLEGLLAQLRANFKSVVKVDSVEQAKASGADAIGLLDFYTAITGFNNGIDIDESVVFLDPAGNRLDTIAAGDKKDVWKTARFSLTPLILTLSAAEAAVKDKFQAALSSSEPLRRFAQARGPASAAPAAAAASGPAVETRRSDVDEPRYKSAEDPNKFALVVGVENYESLPPADYAARDAQAVRRHLLALGYPERNLIFLTGPQAGKSGIEKYVDSWLPRNVDEKSRVFVYFSGHGSPDPKTGQAYLMPWDADAKFLEATGYPVARLYRGLAALKARRVVVALDSCFSGAGGRSVLAKGARPLVAHVDAALPPTDKLVVLAAASGDEITGAAEDQGHGLFTYYLLKGMNERGGSASVKSLYDFLKPRVRDAARRDNRDQTPQLLPAADFSNVKL